MAAFTKVFWGVPDNAIYPVEYQPGEECPAELEAGAVAMGALSTEGAGVVLAHLNATELKKRLDAKNATYKNNASKAELVALLKAVEA